MEIGQSIKSHRNARGLTLQQLEGLTGIDNSSLSRIENGSQSLTNDTMTKLATAFGVTLPELFSAAALDAPPTATLVPTLALGKDGEIAVDYDVKQAFLLEDVRHAGTKICAHRIADDAMSPRLNPGDIVGVDVTDRDVPAGGGTFVLALGSLTVRRIFHTMNGGITVMPVNSTYPTLHLSREEVRTLPVAGRVKVLRGLSGL